MLRKIKYTTSDGFIIAYGNIPDLTAGAGEAVVDYVDIPLTNVSHSKIDLVALPTVSVISKTAGEITTFDNDNTAASGADIETRYATKSNDSDKVIFLKDLIKLQVDGSATKTAVAAL